MNYYDSYRAKLSVSKRKPREHSINHMQKVINSGYENSISYEEAYFNNSDSSTGIQVVSDTKNPSKKIVLMRPGEKISAGDLIKRENDRVWLCVSEDDKIAYSKGFIEECEISLKWLDENGELQTQPSVFYFNTRSNFGEKLDRVMALPDGRRQTILQKNEHTLKLKRGKRFIIGGEAFTVIDFDHVSDKGLVNLSLQSHLINPTADNLELEVADFYNHVSNYKLSILNGNFASVNADQKLIINAQLSNRGVVIDKPTIEFNVSNEDIATINDDGVLTPLDHGIVIVTAHFQNLTAQIQVNISQLIVYNYSGHINGSDNIIVETTKEYSAVFKRNGETVQDESDFYLTDLEGNITTLATITDQDSIRNICRIKAGKKKNQFSTEKFILHVRNKSGLSASQKVITLKPLY
ncbi:hypothetical protein EBB07_29510 [Paenibacillaceae bacterium]|nr:hypothetical protein EBB07_29510 [Paenibacillaceae bacterium]